MQTFITDSREVGYGVEYLDQKRLVKQMLECRQIMAALAGETKGWVHHPATKMWKHKEYYLVDYALAVVAEMSLRGYKYQDNFNKLYGSYINVQKIRPVVTEQFGEEFNKIVYTHRGRLYEKDPEYYAQWSTYTDYRKHVCCERCNYYWPSHLEN